jgi:hypothetical protein
VADRRSGYVFVLVWFRLGILGLIFISVLVGIPDRLSNDFLGTPMKGDVGIAGWGGCFRLISFVSFRLLVGKTHAESWCICLLCQRDLEMYTTYDRKKYCAYF